MQMSTSPKGHGLAWLRVQQIRVQQMSAKQTTLSPGKHWSQPHKCSRTIDSEAVLRRMCRRTSGCLSCAGTVTSSSGAALTMPPSAAAMRTGPRPQPATPSTTKSTRSLALRMPRPCKPAGATHTPGSNSRSRHAKLSAIAQTFEGSSEAVRKASANEVDSASKRCWPAMWARLPGIVMRWSEASQANDNMRTPWKSGSLYAASYQAEAFCCLQSARELPPAWPGGAGGCLKRSRK
mmetsp:Transcript_63919/g.207767  ORF Transcript_63919/g.207767 Transcript_63919/m.207767 type:complete len:236 (-) Transcript_63919:228-935(-)